MLLEIIKQCTSNWDNLGENLNGRSENCIWRGASRKVANCYKEIVFFYLKMPYLFCEVLLFCNAHCYFHKWIPSLKCDCKITTASFISSFDPRRFSARHRLRFGTRWKSKGSLSREYGGFSNDSYLKSLNIPTAKNFL